VAEYKRIHYAVNIPSQKINLWYDRDKLEIILYNLLSNAFKYTPEEGSVGLHVKACHNNVELQNGLSSTDSEIFSEGYVEIMVEDNGRGIPAAHLSHIFERFYQSAQERQDDMYGTGVGLEIVKKFVDLHQGRIVVDSFEASDGRHGKTRFTVRLPLGKAHLKESEIIQDFRNSEDISLYRHPSSTQRLIPEDINEAPEAISGSDKQEEHERSKILIVEDNDELRRFIVNLFKDQYEVLEAADGRAGLETALTRVPDLIVSDIMMPGIDGLELCKTIKEDSRTSHVPVILLTARTAVTFRMEGIETGADDYVTKPFSAELLKIRIRKLIEQRESLRKKYIGGFSLIPEEISLTSVDEKLMKKTIDFVKDHMSDPDLTVEKVAAEIGLSRVHFYRKIKGLTNLSAVEFIRSLRLERAAQLIQSGKLNVSEVRYEVGIQDADYFRKIFKARFGKTPTDYTDREEGEKTPNT
jgi:DNA-binding response OmpR family regulator